MSAAASGDAARDRRLDYGRDRGAYKDPRQCTMEQIARRPRTSNNEDGPKAITRQSQVLDRPANAAQTGGSSWPEAFGRWSVRPFAVRSASLAMKARSFGTERGKGCAGGAVGDKRLAGQARIGAVSARLRRK